MLVGIIYIIANVGSSDIYKILNYTFSENEQFWLFIGFFFSFAVKVPMWPFHTWLPDAHVQAPTAGSIILAGYTLKNGRLWLFKIFTSYFSRCFFIISTLYFLSFLYCNNFYIFSRICTK